MGALMLGDIDECERILDEIARDAAGAVRSGCTPTESGDPRRARPRPGDVATGLAVYLDASRRWPQSAFPGMEPSGMEPWTMVAEAAALIAHVRYARRPSRTPSRDRLAADLLDKGRRLLALADSFLDFPVTGMLLAALGAWLLDTRRSTQEAGVRLLAMAARFSYNRTFPVMAWEPLAEAAERADPAGSPRSWRSTTADRAVS